MNTFNACCRDWAIRSSPSATSGEELIATVEDTHPDLIITDVRMFGMDGDAALETIWARDHVPHCSLGIRLPKILDGQPFGQPLYLYQQAFQMDGSQGGDRIRPRASFRS